MDSIVKGLIRHGSVSSVNTADGTARVLFPDRSNLVSNPLNVMKHAWPVNPGDSVVCLFLPTGSADGFVLGAYYSKDDPPVA